MLNHEEKQMTEEERQRPERRRAEYEAKRQARQQVCYTCTPPSPDYCEECPTGMFLHNLESQHNDVTHVKDWYKAIDSLKKNS